MASSVAQVAESMRIVLEEVARVAGRSSGFVQRQGKMDGATFTQALVFGFQANPNASLSELAQMAATVGVQISPQGLEQRFTEAAARCLQTVLEAAAGQVVTAHPQQAALLQRFNGLYVQDSTTISLPDELHEVWSGCGNRDGVTAALKVQVQWDYLNGQISHLTLHDGRSQDRNAPVQRVALPAGALRLADLGYFNLDVLADLSAQGVYWLTRYRTRTTLFSADGAPLDLLSYLRTHCTAERTLELPVQVAATHHLPARLLAQRVPQEVMEQRRRRLHEQARKKGQAVSQEALALAAWTILLTNVPGELLTVAEALILLRVRWQIELLFKRWKSVARCTRSRSRKRWTILCELYAKLIGCLLHHWQMLLSAWGDPARSWLKVIRTLQQHTLLVATALCSPPLLLVALQAICRTLRSGARLEKRKQHPATFQLLLSVEHLLTLPSDLRAA